LAAPVPDIALLPLPGKATTLYVGKIALSVDEDTMRQLLQACGPVRSWKRVTDPSSGKPKGFGFCEYEDIEGVLCALRLLNNLNLDGQELLLKPNTATTRYIEAVDRQRAAAAAAAAAARAAAAEAAPPGTADGDGADAGADANGAAGEGGEPGAEPGAAPAPEPAPEPADPARAEEERDNAVLERVMALVSERAATSGGGGRRAGAAADADSFLSGLHDERRGSGGRSRSAGERGHRGGDDRSERGLEAEFAREREVERREAEARAREADRLLKERTREWERYERHAPARPAVPCAAAASLSLRAAPLSCGAPLHRAALDTPLCGGCQMPAAWTRRSCV